MRRATARPYLHCAARRDSRQAERLANAAESERMVTLVHGLRYRRRTGSWIGTPAVAVVGRDVERLAGENAPVYVPICVPQHGPSQRAMRGRAARTSRALLTHRTPALALAVPTFGEGRPVVRCVVAA
jgi:hypothetical protein